MDLSDSDIVRSALEAYDLGDVTDVQAHSGTAAKTWRVTTDSGIYLLRTRGSRTSSDALVAYDHGLRRHLLAKGIPTAVPIRTRSEGGTTRVGDLVLELYELVPGRTLSQANTAQMAAAAQMLARFHHATEDFAEAQDLPPVAQYRTLGLEKASRRMEDPSLLRLVYDQLQQDGAGRTYPRQLQTAFDWLDRIERDLAGSAYKALPHTVTHGDYTLANILYVNASITGVFDFDWSRWGPRIRDVADGLFFIAGRRRTALDPGDIWSLTEAVDLEVSRCATWLRRYSELGALTADEMRSVPLALAARWLSVRVEGMAKVPAARRHEFALAHISGPLDWLERTWDDVCGSFYG